VLIADGSNVDRRLVTARLPISNVVIGVRFVNAEVCSCMGGTSRMMVNWVGISDWSCRPCHSSGNQAGRPFCRFPGQK
jgi:hypothetical protein